jgi:hypothetical protein
VSKKYTPARLGGEPEKPAPDPKPARKASRKTAPRETGATATGGWQASGPWLFGLVALLLLLPVWQTDGVWLGNATDMYSYMVPMRDAVHRLGWLAQWNPGPLGGTPAHAAMQLGLLYPPNWLLRIGDTAQGLEATVWLHMAWLAAGGAFLHRALVPQAGLGLQGLGAVLWLASGPLWGHAFAGHVSWVQALAWLPWWLGFAVQTGRTGGLRPALLAAAALGLQVLAGHPQVVFVGGLGGAVLVLLTLFGGPTGTKSAPTTQIKGVVLLGVVAVLAVLLAAGQLWPTAQLAPALNRSLSTPVGIATAFESPPQTLLTLLAPQVGGGPAGSLTSWGGYHETVAFVGAGLAGLVAVGAAQLGLGGLVAVLWLVLCAWLSVGSHGGLLPLLAEHVPGFGAFRVPGRWVLAMWPVLAWLVAAGCQQAWTAPQARKPAAVAVGLMGIGVLVLGLGWSATHSLLQGSLQAAANPQALATAVDQTRMGLLTAAGALLLAALACLQPNLQRLALVCLGGLAVAQGLWFASLHLTTPPAKRQPEATLHWSDATATTLRELSGDGARRVATAASLRQANRPGAVGLPGAGAYEPALTLQATRYGNLLGGRPVDQYAVNHQVRKPNAWLDRLATGLLVHAATDTRTAQDFSAWPEVRRLTDAQGALVVRQHPAPMQRLGSAATLVVEPDGRKALERLTDLAPDTVVVDQALPAPGTLAPVLTLRKDQPTEVEIEVVATGPSVVVLRDAMAPGWTATVDGQPQPIALADGLFRAVAMTQGRHVLRFVFSAPGLQTGLAAQGGAWLVWLLLFAWVWRKRPQN